MCLIIVAVTTEVRHTWINEFLSNNDRQETKELAEVQEVVQLCIKPIVDYKWLTSGDFSFLVHLS